jgi:tetratricopeptide (TPR) repeat protein
MSGYEVAHLDGIEELTDGREPYRPVRHHFGITAFGINSWTAREAGDRILNEHDESDDGAEELYLVQRGRAVFELDGERLDAPAGTLVYVRLIAVGGVPGKAYEPDGWELWGPIRPLYEAGKYGEAADRGRELLDGDPKYSNLLYNLACTESLAGRTTDAIEHLRQAIGLTDLARSYAKDDPDFDPIRDEPAFKELIG